MTLYLFIGERVALVSVGIAFISEYRWQGDYYRRQGVLMALEAAALTTRNQRIQGTLGHQ